MPPYLDAEAGRVSLLRHCAFPPGSAEDVGADFRFAPGLFLKDTKEETQNTSSRPRRSFQKSSM